MDRRDRLRGLDVLRGRMRMSGGGLNNIVLGPE